MVPDSRADARLALAMLVAAGLGCASRAPSAPSPSVQQPAADERAVVNVDPSVLVTELDGQPIRASPDAVPTPLILAPGEHAFKVKRRKLIKSVQKVTTHTFGTKSRDTATATCESCRLNLALHAGAQYRLATDEAGEKNWTWVASLRGAGVEATCTPQLVARELVGRDLFLCCTMRFYDRKATDANYLYDDRLDPRLPGSRVTRLLAGTPVRITDADRLYIAFTTADGNTYHLWLEYGADHIDAPSYFERIFVASDPSLPLAGAPAGVVAAVRSGRVVIGMTRDQALLARGYPPLHRTPDLDGSQWLYYETRGLGEYVTFTDGVVTNMRRGPAP